MDTLVIVLIVLVLVLAGIAAWFIFREQRSRRLRAQFGPEYERSIEASDDRRAGEAELLEREKRHRELDIRPLHDDERKRFSDRWSGVQQGFVDDPSRAVADADALVDDLMRTRGYPLDDFEQRAADISVEHPVVVQRYREAREIAEANEAGRADTEDLRQAVTSYRALVVALLEPAPVRDERDQVDETRTDETRADERERVDETRTDKARADETRVDERVEHDGHRPTDERVERDRHQAADERTADRQTTDPDQDHTRREMRT